MPFPSVRSPGSSLWYFWSLACPQPSPVPNKSGLSSFQEGRDHLGTESDGRLSFIFIIKFNNPHTASTLGGKYE